MKVYDVALYTNVKTAYGSDKGGLAHAERLASNAWTQEEWTVALCHDLVEDKYATYEHLVEWGLTPREIAAVKLLTRVENQTYTEYIDSIMRAVNVQAGGAELALRVKYMDLCDHVASGRIGNIKRSHALRYYKAIQRLGFLLCKED